MYSTDLAHIHDAGFGDFANAVAPEIARILRNERRRILTRHMTMTRRTARGLRRSRETHHVHVYDRRTVRRMLARCGLDIVVSRAYGRYRLCPATSP
jgi:hypothetical protein